MATVHPAHLKVGDRFVDETGVESPRTRPYPNIGPGCRARDRGLSGEITIEITIMVRAGDPVLGGIFARSARGI
jgi:hypothetical protein